jgi:RNA polymerase sigma-70 factor (ECF subfamily)
MDETRLRTGFTDEVEHVYRDQGERLWRSVFLFAGDREIASDAVAEAFAQVLRRGEAVRSVEHWVWRTAFRVAAGLLQRRRAVGPPHQEQTYDIPQETIDLIRALRALSPKQRAAVVLHHYGDRPIREVAALLNSTPAAVGVHLHRARARLRILLEERDG